MNKELKALQEALAKRNDEIQAIISKAVAAGSTPNDEDEAKIAELEKQVASIEKNIARVSKQVELTKTVEVKPVAEEPAVGKPEPKVQVIDTQEKSITFAQAIRAKMLSAHELKKGVVLPVSEAGKQLGYNENVISYIEKATLGTTTNAPFAGVLTQQDLYKGDFIDLLRNATVFNKLTGVRNVPFNVKINGQATSSTASWVGEGAAKPVTNPTFNQISIDEHKLAAIVIYTEELLRRADPAIDKLVRDDLIEASAALVDTTFLGNAAATATQPAGILNGVTPVPATGTTYDKVEADLMTLITAFVAANMGTDGAYFLMSETRAMQLALLRDPLGNTFFNGMSFAGGARSLLGIPVITSQAVNANQIILLKANELLVAQDGGVDISYSDQATIVDGTGGGATTHNLWQENKYAIRAEKFITWAKRRPTIAGAIQYS